MFFVVRMAFSKSYLLSHLSESDWCGAQVSFLPMHLGFASLFFVCLYSPPPPERKRLVTPRAARHPTELFGLHGSGRMGLLDRNRTKFLKPDVGMIPIMCPMRILGRLRPLFSIIKPRVSGDLESHFHLQKLCRAR